MGRDRKKMVAAAAAVLESLWREKAAEDEKKGHPPASIWALSGRIALMASHGPVPFRIFPSRGGSSGK